MTISDEDFEAVCKRIETSFESPETACAVIGIGSKARSFRRHGDPITSDSPERVSRYAQANNRKMTWLEEEMFRLINLEPPTDDNGRTDNAWVTWRKNQVDVIKWKLSKSYPKDFGDSTKLEHSGSIETSASRSIDLIPEDDE